MKFVTLAGYGPGWVLFPNLISSPSAQSDLGGSPESYNWPYDSRRNLQGQEKVLGAGVFYQKLSQ